MRETFCNLSGVWQFAFDDENVGLQEGWYRPGYVRNKTITVPFCYQGKVGGMQTWGYHGKEADEESFFHCYQECTEAILEIPYCRGHVAFNCSNL